MNVLSIDCGLHSCAWTKMNIETFEILEQGAIDFMPKITKPEMADFARAVSQKLPPPCHHVIIENQTQVSRKSNPNKYCVAMQYFAMFHYSQMADTEVHIVPANIKFKLVPSFEERKKMAMSLYTGKKTKVGRYELNKLYARVEFAGVLDMPVPEYCKKIGIKKSAFGDVSDSYLLAKAWIKLFLIHH